MSQLLIGTYTQVLQHVRGGADGILSLPTDRLIGRAELAIRAVNPSWIIANSHGTRVYAVAETASFEGSPGGAVVAFARDPLDGSLSLLNSLPSGGSEPAHLALDRNEKFIVVANYGGGTVAAISLTKTGDLAIESSRVQHQGSSLDRERQASPHPHQVVLDPISGLLLVPDLGLDAVLVYELSARGELVERTELRLSVPAGSGPRHLAFDPTGAHLFVLNELTSSVTVFIRDGRGFSAVATHPTLPHDFVGHNQAAAIRVARSGRFVWVSHRGLDAIVTLKFDVRTSSMKLTAVQPSGGRLPRDFILASQDRRMVVANQDSDNLSVFEVHPDGSLAILSRCSAATPVCLLPL